MLNSFLPQHTHDLAHPLFAPIVCVLEFLFCLIEPFEVVVLRHNDLGGAIELALEVRDFFLPGLPHLEWFFRSHLLPAVSSRLSSFCVPFCHSLTVFLFLLPGGGSSRRPPFPISVRCKCRWNNAPSFWFRHEPFWLFSCEVVVGPSPLLGSLPLPVASRGCGRHLVFSISWWIVGTSLTLVSRGDGFDIHCPCSPSSSWRRVPPPSLVSPSILG